jgi:hypothetical protein
MPLTRESRAGAITPAFLTVAGRAGGFPRLCRCPAPDIWKDVHRGELQVSSWVGTVFIWLGVELDIDIAQRAAESLFHAVIQAVKEYPRPSQ